MIRTFSRISKDSDTNLVYCTQISIRMKDIRNLEEYALQDLPGYEEKELTHIMTEDTSFIALGAHRNILKEWKDWYDKHVQFISN